MNSNPALRNPKSILATAIVLAVAASLTACATVPPAGPGAPPSFVGDTPSSEGDVVGTGTVLQNGDNAPEFCLGGVMDSYPPQCSGVELIGWDWSSVEGSETSGDVTWGTYAIWGAFDGDTLTVTDSVLLALYDPMFVQDPQLLPENAGVTAESELVAVQEKLHADAPFEVLVSYPSNGYVFATVVFDDGTYQEWANNRYGPDVVEIRSALTPVDAG